MRLRREDADDAFRLVGNLGPPRRFGAQAAFDETRAEAAAGRRRHLWAATFLPAEAEGGVGFAIRLPGDGDAASFADACDHTGHARRDAP